MLRRTTVRTFAVIGITAIAVFAQQKVPQWQIDAGGKAKFDVASVKPDTATPNEQNVSTNVPLDAMDDFTPSGGLFSATNLGLFGYIQFAYKLTSFQGKTFYDSLPKWTNTIRFDIQAHAPASMNPTKDQLRLMMQALLAERFKLVAHYETKRLPVMALVLDKPGKLGPNIQQHPPGNEPCSSELTSNGSPRPVTNAGGYPQICGVLIAWMEGGRIHDGGRNMDLQVVANQLTGAGYGIDRPVLDRTGLSGKYDLVFDFSPPAQVMLPGTQVDEFGPTFLEALKAQLGMKLEAQTGPVDVLVVDHVEEPSPN